MNGCDVVVIGGGPGGLAAAIAAKKEGADVLLIEREARLGGILKQCIHDGFGLIRFGEKLSGPEYVERFIDEFHALSIPCHTLTFVTSIEKKDGVFHICIVNQKGMQEIRAKAIVLATGCRERTAKQVFIHGTRPAGVLTAGTAQHFVNLMGEMPAKKCVILGSGDIGLIMARRLTLEGATVLGVYEVKPTPSGLTRNIVQCLEDYEIPLHLSYTVTRVFGEERLEAVEVSKVDENMHPIRGTEQKIACDALILSVGLIPENEIAETLKVPIDRRTKGPVCDETFQTLVTGIYSCGNATHVNDLVDYVSESGEIAGRSAAQFYGESECSIELQVDSSLLYIVPRRIRIVPREDPFTIYFRSSEILEKGTLIITMDGEVVYEKTIHNLKPPEMERLQIDRDSLRFNESSQVVVSIRREG